MKKIILIIICQLGITIIGHSQEKFGFKKGDYLITGNVGFSSKSFEQTSDINLTFSTKFQTFIAANWSSGINFYYGQSKIDENVTLLNRSSLGIGAFTSYFFTPQNQFTISTSLGFNYSLEKDILTKASGSKIELSVYPGFHYFLSNSFNLDASLGKVALERSRQNNSNVTLFGINAQIKTITFGVTYKW